MTDKIENKKLLDEWEEKYTQLLEVAMKVNKASFSEGFFETIFKNINKLPAVETMIHVSALAFAAVKLGFIGQEEFYMLIEKMQKVLGDKNES